MGRKFWLTKAVVSQKARFSFPWANFKVVFNPRDEEISIPEIHGSFGNCTPVGVNYFLFQPMIVPYINSCSAVIRISSPLWEGLLKWSCQWWCNAILCLACLWVIITISYQKHTFLFFRILYGINIIRDHKYANSNINLFDGHLT